MENQAKIKKGKLLSVFITALLIFSVALCLFVFVQVVTRGYVSFAGYSFFRVTTGSMEPTLPIGTLILTRETDIDSIELDDVVSFYSKEQYMQGKIITHRVIDREVSADGSVLLTTRGDANSSADVYFVDRDNLIGKLVWSSKDDSVIASIVAFLSGKIGFFTCIALPILLVAVVIFKRSMGTMMKEIKNLKEQIAEAPADGAADMSECESAEKPATPDEAKGDMPDISPEEFDAMYERIRDELIKELKAENDRGSIEKE